jgi:hypothetical protein
MNNKIIALMMFYYYNHLTPNVMIVVNTTQTPSAFSFIIQQNYYGFVNFENNSFHTFHAKKSLSSASFRIFDSFDHNSIEIGREINMRGM